MMITMILSNFISCNIKQSECVINTLVHIMIFVHTIFIGGASVSQAHGVVFRSKRVS